jgi:acetyl-CoA acyltransferase
MSEAFICDYIRTPIGRFGGALSSVRADDLGSVPLRALMTRNGAVDWGRVDEVIFGCANQADEDSRNVARMSTLLGGLPHTVHGTTINRLCGSGMDAVITAARAIKSSEADLIIAGGVESMSRAPFVLPKATEAFSRTNEIHDTTIGWCFINPVMKAQYGVDSMSETAENVAEDFRISREDQDGFAFRSQAKTAEAQANGRLTQEIVSVTIPQRKDDPVAVAKDERPRATTLEALAKLATPFRKGGSVTAGNASGVNDGAAALIVASERAVKEHGLTPLARILAGATAGVPPRIMGIGPAPAAEKLCLRLGLKPADFDVIDLAGC